MFTFGNIKRSAPAVASIIADMFSGESGIHQPYGNTKNNLRIRPATWTAEAVRRDISSDTADVFLIACGHT